MNRSGFLFRLRQSALLVLVFGTFAAMIGYAHLRDVWARKGKIEPSGGRYFFHRVELAVPSFRQGDERWRSDPLGPTRNTLGAEGCAVASAAMVLASYGFDVDPQRLNRFLTEHGGYTPQGWLYWESAADWSYSDAALRGTTSRRGAGGQVRRWFGEPSRIPPARPGRRLARPSPHRRWRGWLTNAARVRSRPDGC